MPVSSVNFVPELQYYFSQFATNSNIKLNKNAYPIPATISSSYFNAGSFIQLLFDDTWPTYLNYYYYEFKEETSRSLWPKAAIDRISIYSNSAKYYTCDNTSVTTINLFNLKNDDLTLLDKLLEYRLDTTGTTIIDITYANLSTNLSKMIYLYLDLMINNNYDNYDNSTLFSTSTNTLECCYECYLVEKMFNYVSRLGN